MSNILSKHQCNQQSYGKSKRSNYAGLTVQDYKANSKPFWRLSQILSLVQGSKESQS